MNEYLVNVWMQPAPTLFKPLPRIRRSIRTVEGDSLEHAAEKAHALESLPDKMTPRTRMPRVYVEIDKGDGGVCRCGDLGLKLELEVRGSATR